MKRALIFLVTIACLGQPACARAQSEDAASTEDTTPPYARHDEIERARNSQIGAARAQQRRLQALQREMSDRQKGEKQGAAQTDAAPAPQKPAPAKPRCVGACS